MPANGEVRIIDRKGVVLKTVANEEIINISDLKKGMYFIEILSVEERSISKIIK
ncbi:MAG: T9SS type A sorting domain-containing protein [Marinilabiliaceae bacterium]